MKTKSLLSVCVAFSLGLITAPAAEPGKTAEARVGTYDSRVVAFAHFWSDGASKIRNELMTQARAAKTAGDTAKFQELSRALSEMQNRDHLEVFSTAPADEAMVTLKDKLPALQKELGVARFVSKWDEAALKAIAGANCVDVTDRLVRELLPTLTDKQQKTIAKKMKKVDPLPLEKAKQLSAEGKL